MAEVKESGILIQDVETKNIMTKSALPVGGYVALEGEGKPREPAGRSRP